jgi:hypothetical protein
MSSSALRFKSPVLAADRQTRFLKHGKRPRALGAQPYADVLNHGAAVRAEVEQDLLGELVELAGLAAE